MNLSHTVFVGPDGLLKFVYDDELQPLLTLGQAIVARASHVEPTAGNCWTADMGPSGGPVLGPFAFRWVALGAERQWLDRQMSEVTL